MTTSSHPWKQLLLREADALRALAVPHRWGEPSAVKLEEAAVLGCYAIRRLAAGFLLSDSRLHRPIPLTAYPARRTAALLRAEERAAELYDTGAGRPVTHDVLFLCHQVLHNCVFEPRFGPGGELASVLATSDRQRKVALYGIGIHPLADLFRDIATDG
jgi:hypothetical protein